jgi:acylphosphatase
MGRYGTIGSTDSMNARAHILVSGRVQGVFFRDHTRKWAASLQLMGWVRNLPDGRVEAVVEGKKEHIEALISRVKEGPPLANVTDAVVTWEDYQDEFTDFRITW